jgi:hypothetical protein
MAGEKVSGAMFSQAQENRQEIVACSIDPSGDEVIVAVDADKVSVWKQSGDGRFPEGLSFSASEARSIAAWLCAAAARQEGAQR